MERGRDLTGEEFGRLKVIEEIGSKNGSILFLCQCSCGNKKEIKGTDLRSGRTKSCGCYRNEYSKLHNVTHGMSKTRIYTIYNGMRKRCYKPKDSKYKYYGGRGIKICEEWLNDFINFYKWAMGNGYTEELTLERINNDGNYEPSNCKWVTMKEQSTNKRNNHNVEINGELKSITEWSEVYGINRQTVWDRIRKGWNEVEAITTPLLKQKKGDKM